MGAAQLGSPGEAISSIRRNLWGFAENGSGATVSDILTRLAEAQVLDGTIDDALGTIEDALQANPEELVFQPNVLPCHGELRLKLARANWPKPTSAKQSHLRKR